jgi:hypothetical protein
MAVRARGDPGSLPLRVAETAPASLRWALRGQRQLAVSTQPGSAEAALLPAGASPQGASPQGAFIGRAFTTSSSASLAPARCDWTDGQVSCLGLARWLAFREAGAATPSQWVLWISPDLARRISGQP